MSRRSNFPSIEEAQRRYPHGTYARYVFGRCRCVLCRSARTDYEVTRATAKSPWILEPEGDEWVITHKTLRHERFRSTDRIEAVRQLVRMNASAGEEFTGRLVPIRPVRKHLEWLSAQGIGCKTVSRVSGVSHSVLQRMRGAPGSGDPIKRTRTSTAERILAVTPADVAGGQNVDAGPTWERIDCLLAGGWRRWEVAVAVCPTSAERVRKGSRPGLQIKRDLVFARTARLVEQLHEREVASNPKVREHCTHLRRLSDEALEARQREILRHFRTRPKKAMAS